MDFALDAFTSPSFIWPARRFRPAQKVKPMVSDADSIQRANPFARSTDHRKLDEMLDRWAVWVHAGRLEQFHVGAAEFWASGHSDIEGLEHWADTRDAVILESAFLDLVPIEQCAVTHIHFGAVFRSNRGEKMEDVYLRARANLSDGLRRRKVD